ncbi:MAG: hypothetical protein HGA85_09135 [Nanoarchaeota archaeon]|nr:hypothetical protein [Nanoarchaeota archaeon]
MEEFKSARAECNVDVVKGELVFEIVAKDPVSAKAILNSILKIYETYEKTRAIK